MRKPFFITCFQNSAALDRARLGVLFVAMFLFTINFITSVNAANDNENVFGAGPYKVQVEVNPETPKVGRNKVSIWLKNKAGDPLSGATLKAVAVMPSMGSMPAMYAPAEITETDPGLYEGEFEPSMGGEWPLTIEINSAAGNAEIIFDLATGRKGLRCSTCGGQHTTPGTIYVDPARRQLIGISTGSVEQKNLYVNIRAAGKITYDESTLNDVSLKFNGWIGKLYANVIGKSVKKGQPLFTVYSPELLATQEEYLLILKRGKDKRLRRATHRRLRLWNLSPQQIKDLGKRGKALEYVPILAPNDGIVIDKQIVAGSAFKAGQRLLRTADVSHVWVEAQVYDYELPIIKIGMQANVILPELQDRKYPAEIKFIYPFMESDTRTVRVRVELDNADGFLRPDMYAQLFLSADLGKRLLVPESAVLYAGHHRVVFLDLGDGKLSPRKIKTGQRNNEWIEVLKGLQEGDKVVTSGNFLIAAESKLKSGVEQW
jgi:Cu(I)/Ag(I) efflux system membrane fusion protein